MKGFFTKIKKKSIKSILRVIKRNSHERIHLMQTKLESGSNLGQFIIKCQIPSIHSKHFPIIQPDINDVRFVNQLLCRIAFDMKTPYLS